MRFKTMFRYDNKQEVDIISFCEELKASKEEFEVYIGTDSKFEQGEITYTTVIAFRFGNRGVRGIFRKFSEIHQDFEKYQKKIVKKSHKRERNRKDLRYEIYSRLKKETELSLEVAEYVKAILTIKQIDLDYNSKEMWLSHMMVEECKVLCECRGFKTSVKNTSMPQVATIFADKIL
jgi:predicted RNase H-related nuclease YkuK (DUF458 family)